MSSPSALRGLRLWVVVAAFILSVTAFAAASLCSGTVCTPYVDAIRGGIGCQRKRPISLRFMLSMAKENHYVESGTEQNTTTYAFAPCVDEISALALNSAPFLSTGYAVKTTTTPPTTSYAFTDQRDDKYLSVYGFGMSNQTMFPEPGVSAGAVVVAKNGFDACGDPTMVGVVTILSLEIGMHKGFFNYIGQAGQSTATVPNPQYNATLCKNNNGSGAGHKTTTATVSTTENPPGDIDYCSKTINVTVPETNVQPAKVGFTPTCDAHDNCRLGDPEAYVCIGNVTGQKNCGLCHSNATLLASDSSLTVWVSYVGTDRRNTVMTSSGDNPINYANFVRHGAFQTISRKFSSLVRGNFSDLDLPTTFIHT